MSHFQASPAYQAPWAQQVIESLCDVVVEADSRDEARGAFRVFAQCRADENELDLGDHWDGGFHRVADLGLGEYRVQAYCSHELLAAFEAHELREE